MLNLSANSANAQPSSLQDNVFAFPPAPDIEASPNNQLAGDAEAADSGFIFRDRAPRREDPKDKVAFSTRAQDALRGLRRVQELEKKFPVEASERGRHGKGRSQKPAHPGKSSLPENIAALFGARSPGHVVSAMKPEVHHAIHQQSQTKVTWKKPVAPSPEPVRSVVARTFAGAIQTIHAIRDIRGYANNNLGWDSHVSATA